MIGTAPEPATLRQLRRGARTRTRPSVGERPRVVSALPVYAATDWHHHQGPSGTVPPPTQPPPAPRLPATPPASAARRSTPVGLPRLAAANRVVPPSCSMSSIAAAPRASLRPRTITSRQSLLNQNWGECALPERTRDQVENAYRHDQCRDRADETCAGANESSYGIDQIRDSVKEGGQRQDARPPPAPRKVAD